MQLQGGIYPGPPGMLLVFYRLVSAPDNLITPVSRVVPPPPSCGQERGMAIFPLRLSHLGQGFLAFLSVHPTITFGLIHRFQVCFSVTRQFSASIIILVEPR